MAITNPALIALAAAVTAAADATAKTAAMMDGLISATLIDMANPGVVSPNQLSKVAMMKAEIVANAAEFLTAMTP